MSTLRIPKSDDVVPSTGEFCPYVHIFFQLGDGSYIAFFDLGDNERAEPSPNTPAWVNHLALRVDSEAELLAANARLVRASLEVDDCILHAPFDGEIADRMLDPGGFARPGSPILLMVARERVRVLVDVPESDFAHVSEGTKVQLRVVALGTTMQGVIARRAPSAA